jgi:hypothetical protein
MPKGIGTFKTLADVKRKMATLEGRLRTGNNYEKSPGLNPDNQAVLNQLDTTRKLTQRAESNAAALKAPLVKTYDTVRQAQDTIVTMMETMKRLDSSNVLNQNAINSLKNSIGNGLNTFLDIIGSKYLGNTLVGPRLTVMKPLSTISTAAINLAGLNYAAGTVRTVTNNPLLFATESGGRLVRGCFAFRAVDATASTSVVDGVIDEITVTNGTGANAYNINLKIGGQTFTHENLVQANLNNGTALTFRNATYGNIQFSFNATNMFGKTTTVTAAAGNIFGNNAAVNLKDLFEKNLFGNEQVGVFVARKLSNETQNGFTLETGILKAPTAGTYTLFRNQGAFELLETHQAPSEVTNTNVVDGKTQYTFSNGFVLALDGYDANAPFAPITFEVAENKEELTLSASISSEIGLDPETISLEPLGKAAFNPAEIKLDTPAEARKTSEYLAGVLDRMGDMIINLAGAIDRISGKEERLVGDAELLEEVGNTAFGAKSDPLKLLEENAELRNLMLEIVNALMGRMNTAKAVDGLVNQQLSN